jgi:hypothetical protein
MTRVAMDGFRGPLCAVVYRGTLADGREGEIRLTMAAEAATLSDGWKRLEARFGVVDPRTVEIEIREVGGQAGPVPFGGKSKIKPVFEYC